MRERVNVLDVLIDRVDRQRLGAAVDAMVEESGSHRIVPVNLDVLRLACRNSAVRQLINSADLVTADGMPVVWASRLCGDPLPERVTGCDVVWASAEAAARRGLSIFILGGLPGVADLAALALRRRLPALRIAGTMSPPFRACDLAEEERLAAAVRAARADFLFVGLGAPRQEAFIERWLGHFGARVCVSIGAVVDFLSGRLPRAPHWLQANGLEWLYRLLLEPRRLWRRYLVDDLPILLQLIAASTRHGGSRRLAWQTDGRPNGADHPPDQVKE